MPDTKWAKEILERADRGEKIPKADLQKASDILHDELSETAAKSKTLPSRAKNQTVLAECLGLERKTIQRWKKDNPDTFPRPKANGSYDVDAVIKWMDANGKSAPNVPAGGEGLEEGESIVSLKMRQLRLMCEKLEHELSVKKGEYTANVDVEQWVGNMVSEAKSILLRIPSKAAPILAGMSPAEIEDYLKECVDEALAKLHNASS